MKLVEQYLQAISKNLPYKERNDIIAELRTLIYDEIEEQYTDPSINQIEEYILNFGAPREVAKRFTGDKHVILPQFTDLFFTITKIIILAVTLGFFVLFTTKIFTQNIEAQHIFLELIKLPLQIVREAFKAIGTLALIFILISKIMQNEKNTLEGEWSLDEIKDIKLNDDSVSILEALAGIFFLSFFIFIINLYPIFISILESTLDTILPNGLGNKIDVGVFRIYLIPITALIVIQIIQYVIQLIQARKSNLTKFINIGRMTLEVIINFIMYRDLNLYTYNESIIGFKLIFLIAAVGGFIGVISEIIKLKKNLE